MDPLAFNNVRGLAGTPAGARDRNGSEAEEDNGDEVVRRPRRGPTGVNLDDIPRVKDDTGDKVMDSFVLFLEKSVYFFPIAPNDQLMFQIHRRDRSASNTCDRA